MRWFACWMMVEILQLMLKSKQSDKQIRGFQGSPRTQKCSGTLKGTHCGANECPLSKWKRSMTSFSGRTVLSSFRRSLLPLKQLFQVCNPRGILQVCLVKCGISSLASRLLGRAWTAGCTGSCPSSLCSHPTPLLPRQASPSALAQAPVKMAGCSPKNKPPFSAEQKWTGPAPLPPRQPHTP